MSWIDSSHMKKCKCMKMCHYPQLFRKCILNHFPIFPLTPVRVAIIDKTNDNECWRGCQKREICVTCCSHCGVSMAFFFQTLKIELLKDPSMPPWIWTQKNLSQQTKEILEHPYLLQLNSQWSTYESSLDIHKKIMND